MRAVSISILWKAALFLTLISPAQAQNGDPRRGFAMAREACAGCHAISKSRHSPNARAPAFVAIAAVPGMTVLALQVSLQTSHRTMPNLILSADERANIAAYIVSLRPDGSR
jgi:mono/diheme cytochrome c family protein